MLRLCCLGHTYWTRVNRLLPPPLADKQKPILFENQIIIFQIMPMIVVAFSSADKRLLREDELTELFIHKLFKISCSHTVRLAYTYRALLLTMNRARVHAAARSAVARLMQVRTHLHRDRAVIAFQALIYALKYVTTEAEGDAHALVASLVEGVASLVRHYRITWTDSVESICITSLMLDYLERGRLPARLCVQCVQLAHLTVAHFMPPNLALLVEDENAEREDESSISRLVRVALELSRDSAWEVRDSALELLECIVDISRERFPPFRRLVEEAAVIPALARAAQNDEEPYVRASAARALAAVARAGGYHDDEELCASALAWLRAEPHAQVRREHVLLIRDLCARGKHMPDDAQHALLAQLAVADLHWETRCAALDYWECVIQRELAAHGMLDGAFPPVTFSQDSRKIVRLTEQEVRTRLDRALDNLARTGCLAVLAATAADTCDLQVARRAVDIAERHLGCHLRKYGMLECGGIISPSPPFVDTTPATLPPLPCRQHADAVIEGILDDTDLGLLERMPEVEEELPPPTPLPPPHVPPQQFKQLLTQDLASMVERRGDWIAAATTDLGSLLDDMLQEYHQDNALDSNTKDCY